MLTIGETVILAFILGQAFTVEAQSDPYRLPPNYIINHYDINLVIPAEALSGGSPNYTGHVEITFQVKVNTSEVKLHADSSYITLLTIQLDDTDALTDENYSVNNTTNILTLNLPTELVVGKFHVLKLDFKSSLLSGNRGIGLYRAEYRDSNGVVQYLVATKLEANFARYAFPCFDEPDFRATFAYILTYPSEFLALANTPQINSIADNSTGLTTTQFEVTPRMPVYLVSFLIAKYTCSEGNLEGSEQHKYRICSRPDKEYMRNYTMMLTPLAIDNYNSYTGINYTYSMSKLDQVALSQKQGANENWGLVLYRETGLLFDSTIHNNEIRQDILRILHHELAHQWFGNLVTCKWWSEIFLNEGFANLFSYYIADQSQPEFQMEKMLLIHQIHPSMDIDLYAPALRSNASTSSEITAKFRSYSYRMGAAILRMAEHIIGRKVFQKGINKYLTDNQYQSVEPQDLWNALEAVREKVKGSVFPTNSTLGDIMENWVEKAGFPVVNVTLRGSTIVMTQQPFLVRRVNPSRNTWYIPISYSTADLDNINKITTPRGWITPKNDFIIEEFNNSNAWIVVNNQQTGFFRVNYDTKLWNNLATALKAEHFSGIHVLNRAQVVEDSYRLWNSGYISLKQVLVNIEFLAKEESYFVWYPAIRIFKDLLNQSLCVLSLRAALSQHFLKLVENVAVSVPLTTVNETAHVYTMNQVLINEYACKYGSPACVAGAKKVFATYRSTHKRPNINIRSIVYCNAIRHSDDPINDWNFLFAQYQNVSILENFRIIREALSCVSNTTALRNFLFKLQSNDSAEITVRCNLLFETLTNTHEEGVDFVLDFLIENYKAVTDQCGILDEVKSIISHLRSTLTRKDQLEKLQNFIFTTENLPGGNKSAIANVIEMWRIERKLSKTDMSSLYDYFGLNDDDRTTSTTSMIASTGTPSTFATMKSTAPAVLIY